LTCSSRSLSARRNAADPSGVISQSTTVRLDPARLKIAVFCAREPAYQLPDFPIPELFETNYLDTPTEMECVS